MVNLLWYISPTRKTGNLLRSLERFRREDETEGEVTQIGGGGVTQEGRDKRKEAKRKVMADDFGGSEVTNKKHVKTEERQRTTERRMQFTREEKVERE